MASKRLMSTIMPNLLRSTKVVDNSAEQILSVALNSENAEIQYLVKDGAYDLVHTYIPEQYQGQGLGHIFAEKVFDYLVAQDKKFKLTCEFLQHFYSKNIKKYKNNIVD